MPERKSWVEVFLMPVVVACVGIAGTYLITQQQENNAETMSRAQLASTRELAAADRQIKILEIFAEKVTSSDEDQRILALRLLRAVDGDLAEKLATAVLEGEPEESAVRRVADQVAEEGAARAALLPRVYIHIRAEGDRARAHSVGEKLRAAGFVVPGIERLVDRGPSSSQLRYFRTEEEAEAKRIVQTLREVGVEVEARYVRGYEDSDTIRARHYELWFAPGEPRIRTG